MGMNALLARSLGGFYTSSTKESSPDDASVILLEGLRIRSSSSSRALAVGTFCNCRNFPMRKNSVLWRSPTFIRYNFRTVRVVSHTLVYVHGFRVPPNFVLSAKSTTYRDLISRGRERRLFSEIIFLSASRLGPGHTAAGFSIMIGRGRSGRDRKNLQRGHTTFSVFR